MYSPISVAIYAVWDDNKMDSKLSRLENIDPACDDGGDVVLVTDAFAEDLYL
jgi:hypothetical protein